MSNLLQALKKFAADEILKPVDAEIIAELKANQTQLGVDLQAELTAGGASLDAIVTNFVTTKVKVSNPIEEAGIELAESFALPDLQTEIQSLVAAGTADGPTFIAGAIAWLEKEEEEL